MGAFSPDHVIERFKPGDAEAGRRAETLTESEGLRVGLVTMRAGTPPHKHTAPEPISVHALDG